MIMTPEQEAHHIRITNVTSKVLDAYDDFVEHYKVEPDALIIGEYYYRLIFQGINLYNGEVLDKFYGCDIIILPVFDFAFTIKNTEKMARLTGLWE